MEEKVNNIDYVILDYILRVGYTATDLFVDMRARQLLVPEPSTNKSLVQSDEHSQGVWATGHIHLPW